MKTHHEVILTDSVIFDKLGRGQKIEATVSVNSENDLKVGDKVEVYLNGNSPRAPRHSGHIVTVNGPAKVSPDGLQSSTIYVTIDLVES